MPSSKNFPSRVKARRERALAQVQRRVEAAGQVHRNSPWAGTLDSALPKNFAANRLAAAIKEQEVLLKRINSLY